MESDHQGDFVDESKLPKELTEEIEEHKSPEEVQRISESLYAQIIKTTVSEKIKLATVGNREARNILIKDPNRVVIVAVMNSPKLKEEDVLSYATNRSLSDEVVNQISLKIYAEADCVRAGGAARRRHPRIRPTANRSES